VKPMCVLGVGKTLDIASVSRVKSEVVDQMTSFSGLWDRNGIKCVELVLEMSRTSNLSVKI
jgi:hypothetical protein